MVEGVGRRRDESGSGEGGDGRGKRYRFKLSVGSENNFSTLKLPFWSDWNLHWEKGKY